LNPKHDKCCEIQTEYKENLTLQQFKVIDLGVNGKPLFDFVLVINCNFSRICYRFEIFTVKDRKLLILPTPLLFDKRGVGKISGTP